MNLHSPRALRAYLATIGAQPSKRLSQNFLVDGNILRKIATAAACGPDTLALEVGPGPGALSDAILATGARLLAVEKDGKLAQALAERLDNQPHFCGVAHSDILDYPIEEALDSLLLPHQRAQVIANLPYHLTTPIIERLLRASSLFSTLVLMVQDEVAKRMTALPGSRDYSSLSLFLQYHTEPAYAFKVGRRCFYPSPNVDSAVVTLTIKTPPAVRNPDALFALIRSGFRQRRKMLRNSAEDYDSNSIATALESLGLSSHCRAEELSLDQFIALYEYLT